MNKYQEYWQEKLNKYSNQDWASKPTIFATQAINYFPKTGHILDLGAGLGQDSIFFAENGYQVTSCDLSELAKDNIPQELQGKIVFKKLDLSNPLPFELESFDVVYSHLALHYFNEKRTQELFDQIYEILKPGGIFATITNTIEDPEISGFEKIEEDYYNSSDGIMKRYFSVDSMKKFTSKFQKLLLDANGETHKDEIKTLIRFIGKK